MPKFTYKATTSAGKPVEGTLIAGSKQEVIEKLVGKNLTVINLTEEKIGDGNIKKKSFFDRFKKVKLMDILILFNNMGTMMKAGLPIVETLETLGENQKDKQLQTALETIRYDIENGESLGKSLRKFPNIFSNNMVAMIEIGEEGGNLDETIMTLADQLKKSYEMRKKVKGAMTYPIVIIVAMLVIGTFLIAYVLPQITGFMEGMGDLPVTTKMLMWLSDFLQKYIVLIAVGTIGGVIAFKMGMKRSQPFRYRVHKFMFRVPKFGTLIKQMQVAQFSRSFATLLHSGVPIMRAMDIIYNNTSNEPYKAVYAEFKKKLGKGTPLSVAMADHPELFDNLVIRMVAVGEKTGETSKMLFNIADFYDTEVGEFIENISSIIEPLLLFVIGAGVLILALGIITPMMSMTGNINSAANGG